MSVGWQAVSAIFDLAQGFSASEVQPGSLQQPPAPGAPKLPGWVPAPLFSPAELLHEALAHLRAEENPSHGKLSREAGSFPSPLTKENLFTCT